MTLLKRFSEGFLVIGLLMGYLKNFSFANNICIPYLKLTSPKPLRLENLIKPFDRSKLQPVPKGERNEKTFVSSPEAPEVMQRQIAITKVPQQTSNATRSSSGNRLSAEEIVLYIQDDSKAPESLPFKELNLNYTPLLQSTSSANPSIQPSANQPN